ncbi:hypothetical protein [Mesorhizobium sp. KR1-2]|uniref:hypothetical protein n=1 Tax=Mesorhizobium sp. KR1-2 TaxID=3156609 RepID=UPI0032B5B773
MGLLNGALKLLFGGKSQTVMVEADGAVEAAGVDVDAEPGWHRLSGGSSKRDLSPLSQTRMQELAAHVWESNRLANRLIELPVAFLLGEGVRLEVDDEEAQGWLDDFWNDPINRLDLNMEKHVRELALFGEQCWPVFVNEVNGHVRLGKVDPAAIDRVVTDPDNAGMAIGVVVRKPGGGRKVYRVIYPGEEDIFGEGARRMRARMMAGDCFFWRINDLSTGRRGRSDLLSAIDIVDAHEQLIFGEVERAVALRQVIWDVTIKGATPEEVTERARTIEPPSPLSVRVHNENEEWNVLSPNLAAADATETLRTTRNYALGGATIPSFWMADGGDVNLATASSMGEPTYKVFSQRQRLWKAILQDVARFVIRNRLTAIGMPELANDPDYLPRAVFPELTARDVTKYAAALQQVVVSVSQAVQANVMSRETAVRLIAMVAGLLGLEVDATEELDTATKEAARRAENDVFRDPPSSAFSISPYPSRDGLEPGEDAEPREAA